MDNATPPKTDFEVPLQDIWRAINKKRRAIGLAALFFAALFWVYFLTRPVQYQAEGSFKEKAPQTPNLNAPWLADMLLGSSWQKSSSDAKTMMGSKKLLQQVVKNLHLQAKLRKEGSKPAMLRTLQDNLMIDYYMLRNKQHILLESPQLPINVKNIGYSGELPLHLRLVVEPNHSYQIFDEQKKLLGQGRCPGLFATRDFQFEITCEEGIEAAAASYQLTLIPMNDAIQELSRQLDIQSGKDDPSYLTLAYRHRDRTLASRVVNQLMHTYQNYLTTERKKLTDEQIRYLNRREEEMGENLSRIMEEYAAKIAGEVSTLGYAESKKAMDFLSQQMQEIKQHSLKLDLDLMKLLKVQHQPLDKQMEMAAHTTDRSSSVDSLTQEIFDLKHEANIIALAIRNSPCEGKNQWKESFLSQMQELEHTRTCAKEASFLLAALQEDQFPAPVYLADHSEYMVDIWQQELDKARISSKGCQDFKEQYGAYLHNLCRYLQVKEKTIQEKLQHQQPPTLEFQQINLDTCKNLYLSYSKDMNCLEAEILHYNFLIDEINKPGFELSSVGSVINDLVTQELVNSASTLAQALHDDSNRSDKEKERIRNELQVKKRFLSLHLSQTVSLLRLKKNLLKDKVTQLEHAMLELIRQRISILEKRFVEHIGLYIGNINDEKELIAERESGLRKDLAAIPQKWAAEKLVEQKIKMNAAMVEEIAKLVESKNISNNLETVLSSPLDLATPPTMPARPHIFFIALLGALFGAFVSTGGVLTGCLLRGFPFSKESLVLKGWHVSGTLGKGKKPSSHTLQELLAFADSSRTDGKENSLLLIEGKHSLVAQELAKLLRKKGSNFLVIDFSDASHPGLLQYFEDEGSPLPITGHRIAYGESWEEGVKEINPQKMHTLLSHLKPKYDRIVAVVQDSCTSVKLRPLIPQFDYAACVLEGETASDLDPFLRTLKHWNKQHKTTFLLVEDC